MKKQNEIAVIMAAGTGTRMMPLTKNIAKPLIPVFNTPMIETLINALRLRNVSKIYVVVGYKKEQFEYLTLKYEGVELVENKEYLDKNNISSIKAVEGVLGNENCFICEADLFVRDSTVFMFDFERSCYFAKFVEGQSEDWVFETKDNRISKIKKGGTSLYNLAGVSYWLKNDIQIISNAVSEVYKEPEHGKYFWDEIVNNKVEEIDVGIHPIEHGQITEIDTIDELRRIEEEAVQSGVTVYGR